ncbi:hypothetical protein [Rhodopirellula sallentina]|uniref:Uncharacterized protein n=1 Tax=Rhodopirellula sallentina SM41 TaxID=1263870 RepID=M5TVE3_9BACT|nr:hypothetical protein [Rhodopirellula sallentina]EMI53167.1 hypothetical protein RSSM_05381 [Rhodopirellula sallentina SM41]
MNFRVSESRYRLGMWASPLLAMTVLMWGVAREYGARERFETRLVQLEREGVSVTASERKLRYESMISAEDRQAWKELFDAIDIFGEMQRDSVEGIDEWVPAGEPWPAEPFAIRMSEQAKPLLERFEELMASEVPLWIPIDAYGGHLYLRWDYGLSSLQALLIEELRLAYHAGDSERAMEWVQKCVDLADRAGRTTEFQKRAKYTLIEERLVGIRATLRYRFWNSEQLEKLARPLRQRDSRVVPVFNPFVVSNFVVSDPLKAEGAWVLYQGEHVRDSAPFGMSGQHALAALDWIQGDPNVGKRTRGDVWQYHEQKERLRRIENRSRSWVSVPFATLNWAMRSDWEVAESQAKQVWDRFEDEQRWTLTAICLRKYHVENGHFPESLDALRSVGADAETWTQTTGERFGYGASGYGRPQGRMAVFWMDDRVSRAGEEKGVGSIPYSKRSWGAERAQQYELWFDRLPADAIEPLPLENAE